jgi:hypothetical protein
MVNTLPGKAFSGLNGLKRRLNRDFEKLVFQDAGQWLCYEQWRAEPVDKSGISAFSGIRNCL